ncbi:hypothetical protein A2955_00700 [Candidatus Woesebacteria bacterium RIFCSPLOWO2_01_FULL_37_19]|uniref:Uncharacterized protein n=2 Tax=Candidatus Woeseibacteriota TaxID=1752722 RepID=A0A1F8B4H8_9BACT|nr:MAG: hypothetical protein A2771_04550 [Candidatus Woesebacteria bacterium RIFCSPHIGHO2_01_FULL_38_26b]OGM58897.1 MAG: hypothetical protein A2955_00700 [Candidatus Woesebacteria bacterium RIFCSPLOWO2_01_FULL_37_19]
MEKAKIIKTVQIFLLLFVVLTVFIVSELLYMANNIPYYLVEYYFSKALNSAEMNRGTESIDNLFKSANFIISNNSRKYPDFIPPKYYPKISNSEIEVKVAEVLEKIPISIDPTSRLILVFYRLGLVASSSSDASLALELWQTASYIDPELSHIYVETANLFLIQGNSEKSYEVINTCMKLMSPKKHCEDYKANLLDKGVIEKVGFLDRELNKLYGI